MASFTLFKGGVLTGRHRQRIGWFGILICEVEIQLNGGIGRWVRADDWAWSEALRWYEAGGFEEPCEADKWTGSR